MKTRAISIWQPHANMIATGQQTIYSCAWPTKHRGDLLICAARRVHGPAVELDLQPPAQGYLEGAALAWADLWACRPMQREDAEDACVDDWLGRFAWCLRDVRPLAVPFPVQGQQGLFWVDVATGEAVR